MFVRKEGGGSYSTLPWLWTGGEDGASMTRYAFAWSKKPCWFNRSQKWQIQVVITLTTLPGSKLQTSATVCSHLEVEASQMPSEASISFPPASDNGYENKIFMTTREVAKYLRKNSKRMVIIMIHICNRKYRNTLTCLTWGTEIINSPASTSPGDLDRHKSPGQQGRGPIWKGPKSVNVNINYHRKYVF